MSGTAEATAPSWPSSPVSWTISGLRRGENQTMTSRITLMKVIASPQPTSTRPPTASARFAETAKRSWPQAMTPAPISSIRLEPSRSTRTPTGICMPA